MEFFCCSLLVVPPMLSRAQRCCFANKHRSCVVNDQVRFFDTSARKDCNVIHGRLDKHAAKRRLGRVRSALKQSSGLDGICSKTYGTIPSHTPDMSTFHRVVHCWCEFELGIFICRVSTWLAQALTASEHCEHTRHCEERNASSGCGIEAQVFSQKSHWM